MYLGIDVGTSSVKLILIDRNQQIIGAQSAELDIARPHPGWAEQNAADWIRATQAAIERLKCSKPIEFSTLKGIGLSGQMHGATVLDSEGNPLRPCILWNDTRSHREADEMNEDSRYRRITGNLVFPGFTAPKLEWIRRNEPTVFARIAKILLPKDFLRFWLTGDYVSDMSDSSGTSWLDVQNRCWSEELLASGGLSLGQMPQLVECTAIAGALRAELANLWGIPSGAKVVVAGGAGDNASAALGAGIINPDTALLSLGTSGVLFSPVSEFSPSFVQNGIHQFCYLPGSWHQMGVILSAIDSLNWLARVTGASPEELTAELASEDLIPAGDVIFLPYLSGERTPHNDALARGCFIGLFHQTDRRALTQAVLEGVAFALRDCLEALRQLGTEPKRIIAVGGGARCTRWLRVIACVLGLPIEVPSSESGAAFGAARLGLLAAEGIAEVRQVFTAPLAQRIDPPSCPALRARYERNYRRYKALYPALRNIEDENP